MAGSSSPMGASLRYFAPLNGGELVTNLPAESRRLAGGIDCIIMICFELNDAKLMTLIDTLMERLDHHSDRCAQVPGSGVILVAVVAAKYGSAHMTLWCIWEEISHHPFNL